MKHLKDFFYDKNDIVLTFVILVIATIIIAWRMDVIMEYPATLAKQTHTTTTTQNVETIPDESVPADEPSENKEPSSSEGVKPVESLWINGTLSKDVTVSVSSGSATAAVNSLIDAGLFDSYEQFSDACEKIGASPEDIKATSFTFAKGSSRSDIASKVTQ